MSIVVALIIGIAIAALALWAIQYFAPVELQYPLRIIIIVAVIIWMIWILWPIVSDLVTP